MSAAVVLQRIELPAGSSDTERVVLLLVRADDAARLALAAQWGTWWQTAKERFTKPGKTPAYFRGRGWKLGELVVQVAFPRRTQELHLVGEKDGRVHGVIVTTLPGDLIKRNRPALFGGLAALSDVDPEDLLWVEYIATAPWLQRDDEGKAEGLAGVGAVLMKAAVERANKKTASGCIGLHAEGDEARATYRSERWGMFEDGCDGDERPEEADASFADAEDIANGYRVFAFSKARAKSFPQSKKG